MRLPSKRFLISLVRQGKPNYPAFTGTEACASIGNEHFCTEERDFTHYETLRNVCASCPLLEDCFNWALHNEDFHFWGGTSAIERRRIREELKLKRLRSIAA
jgi:hypothetical protein